MQSRRAMGTETQRACREEASAKTTVPVEWLGAGRCFALSRSSACCRGQGEAFGDAVAALVLAALGQMLRPHWLIARIAALCSRLWPDPPGDRRTLHTPCLVRS